jgi:nitric oxide reductase activation protein
MQIPTLPGQTQRGPFSQREDPNNADPATRHAQEDAAKQRNAERQTRLVADTNKLLQLAQDLKTEVDKSNKEVLSVSVVKKADEIEKLAKSVKDRMKSE